jgi:hypothetical protein
MKVLRTTGVPSEIRTRHLHNTTLERYRYVSLLGGARPERPVVAPLTTPHLCNPQVHYTVHKSSPTFCVMFRNQLIFIASNCSLPTHPQGLPLVGCPRLLIEYICSYPPYLEAVASIRHLRTRHAVVTGDPLKHLCHLCFKVPSDGTIRVVHGEREEKGVIEDE